jgi:CarD family transcriptional regulator
MPAFFIDRFYHFSYHKIKVCSEELKFMFEVGEYVVHPLHGVGRIVERKQVKVMNRLGEYYVLEPLVEKLNKVMIPVDRIEDLNIRKVLAPKQIEFLMDKISKYSPDPTQDKSVNWNVTYKKNVEIIKRGGIEQVGRLCKKLVAKNKIKPLGTKEEELLSIGRKIIVSEMMVSLGIDQDEALRRFTFAMEESQFINPQC